MELIEDLSNGGRMLVGRSRGSPPLIQSAEGIEVVNQLPPGLASNSHAHDSTLAPLQKLTAAIEHVIKSLCGDEASSDRGVPATSAGEGRYPISH